jgi:hypothetical protein
VEDRALERSQQVFSEGESQDLVRGERDIAEPEVLQEAVVDASLATLAHHREACEHQGVEVAVDGAAHAAELFGQLVQLTPCAALRQPLDELPLPGELVAPHAGSLARFQSVKNSASWSSIARASA